MTILIDTNIFYAHHDRDAKNHKYAKKAITDVLKGEYGTPYTSDYIFDETVTLTRKHMGNFMEAKTIADRILDKINLLYVDEKIFEKSINNFEKYNDQPLNFTDITTITLFYKHNIDYLLSFNRDFDGIINRIGLKQI